MTLPPRCVRKEYGGSLGGELPTSTAYLNSQTKMEAGMEVCEVNWEWVGSIPRKYNINTDREEPEIVPTGYYESFGKPGYRHRKMDSK